MAHTTAEEAMFLEKETNSKAVEDRPLENVNEENKLTVKEKRLKTLTAYFCYTIHVNTLLSM